MSIEAVISKIAYDEIEEEPSYDKTRAEIHHHDGHVTRMELLDSGKLLINGEVKDQLPALPKKVVKIILY